MFLPMVISADASKPLKNGSQSVRIYIAGGSGGMKILGFFDKTDICKAKKIIGSMVDLDIVADFSSTLIRTW
jgi:hypothetical protein